MESVARDVRHTRQPLDIIPSFFYLNSDSNTETVPLLHFQWNIVGKICFSISDNKLAKPQSTVRL